MWRFHHQKVGLMNHYSEISTVFHSMYLPKERLTLDVQKMPFNSYHTHIRLPIQNLNFTKHGVFLAMRDYPKNCNFPMVSITFWKIHNVYRPGDCDVDTAVTHIWTLIVRGCSTRVGWGGGGSV